MTDRYDHPHAEPVGAPGDDDSLRQSAGYAPSDHPDAPRDERATGAATEEAAGHGSAVDRPDGPNAGADADDTGADDHATARAQVGARSHVNARRATHTELPDADAHGVPAGDAPQYGVGPFSVREVALLGLWAVTFLVSFFPTNNLPANVRVLGGGSNVWLSGLWWIPTVALPTLAVGLLVLRRLSPQGIRRVGSLGIDQFASVAFSVAALVWTSWVWDTVSVAIETGLWTRTWVVWVGAVFTLAGVVLTVFAPVIPPFEQDFQERPETPAHRNARPVRAVAPRPPRPRPVRTAPAPAADESENPDTSDAPAPGSYTGSTEFPHSAESAPATSVLPTHDDTHDTDVISAGAAPVHEERTAEHQSAPRHPHPQAFWALSPDEREIVDDYGLPIFRIGPTAWALVIEDRGETFVIRHDDGRIGYLHDVTGVTRG
ncbi:hypothetical protein [Microbacterium sp. Bi128]|uniref:hypothetical protein n=1 Tax=Microbacterium sp. Bi128 TaxID=2821115 RepID=UPI001D462DD3|nr:hypothetical protein [Microbacterium sp. Bi128]CAH0187949.1 hypothetical protein SRABI128_01437 [Microbacterium sp. Bi128]